jgi:Leucine-rich repeat (LRR) protein
MPWMQDLNLAGIGLVGTLPATLKIPTGLRTLDLSSNQLEGPLPQSWVLPSSLSWLDVSNNALTGARLLQQPYLL